MAGEKPVSRPPDLDDPAEQWRFNCFIELGFPFDWAVELARAKVDHWVVQRSLKAGCTHAQAVQIFT
jgi:hypothetical protein